MNSGIVQMIVTLLGGLVIFIYGMNLMSDGLQKAAGEKMKNILALLTKNPVVGVLAGGLTTAVLQSSSATTVMAIGFVSAGLMTLPQAISIILGANIGTTITAQLIAFQIGDYAWTFVVIGFIMYFFIKKENIVNIGQTIFGFGMLFIGINIMGNTMEPLAAAPEFANIMMSVKDIPVLGVVIGAVSTAVVQSSSAVIAVIQNLASKAGPDGVTSVIGLSGALPILYGSNIGTTITAIFASIGGTVNAKRAAAAHTIFNIVGSVIFMFFITPFSKFIQYISPSGAELAVISRQIANAHMFFNIINTVIWLPFIWLLVKIVTKIIPEKESEKLPSEPVYLDYNMIGQPVFAMHLACNELTRVANYTLEMVADAKKAFIDGSEDAIARLMQSEEIVNELQGATVQYLSSMFADEALTERQSKELAGLLHIAADIEHIGDHCVNIAEFADDKLKKGYEFSDSAYAELFESFDQVTMMLKDTIKTFETRDTNLAEDVLAQEDAVNENEERLRMTHMKRLETGKCSPEFTVIYTDIIHNIEKIGDSCTNIARIIVSDFEHKGEKAS
ncbi:MAG: Na/Pi cotransporter [Eubacteriales Family XIII. Incertae Sedis bacterium]|nr:MAG: Na/Pi cotransporter [Clostridiales Family XIII bacterium]